MATFNTLTLNNAGNGYVISAAGGGLTSATTNAFDVVTSHLTFINGPPATIGAGVAFPGPVTLQLYDSNNNPQAIAGVVVTLTLSAGTLSPSNVATTNAAGQVTYNGLSTTTAGVITMTASSPGIGSATAVFTVTPGPIVVLVWANEPSNVTAGSLLNPLTVEAEDTYGNLVSNIGINLTISASTLNGTTSMTSDAAGQALYTNLSVDTAGTYTLTAAATGVPSVLSDPFTVSAATEAKLSLVNQPSNVVAGNVMNPVTFQVADQFGNGIGGVTVGIAIAPGAFSSGTTTATTNAAGDAVFGNLVEDVAGTYSLTGSSAGLSSVTSNPFVVTAAAAANLKYLSQPANTLAGVFLNPVTVQALDQFSNPVPSTAIGIAIAPGSLSTGTTPLTSNAAGQVVFVNLSEDTVGTYSLTASAAGLTSIVSQTFTISAAAPAKLTFITQPSNTVAGTTINPITVQAVDQFGNATVGASIGIAIVSRFAHLRHDAADDQRRRPGRLHRFARGYCRHLHAVGDDWFAQRFVAVVRRLAARFLGGPQLFEPADQHDGGSHHQPGDGASGRQVRQSANVAGDQHQHFARVR